MNDRQNMVVATTVAGLLLGIVFLCPWRVEPSEEIQWSPIYQPPMSYVRSYNDENSNKGRSRIEAEEAQVAVDVLLLEVLLIGAGGGMLFVAASRSDEDEAPPGSRH